MTVAFQRMFEILERWNNNHVTPSLSKPHELSYRSSTFYVMFLFQIEATLISLKSSPELLRSLDKNSLSEIDRISTLYLSAERQ